MATLSVQNIATLEELLVLGLAKADALAKLLFEKNLVTQDEYERKLGSEKAMYQALLRDKISH
jgi:hypothetical protein